MTMAERLWVSTYNLPTKFNTRTHWIRVSVRLRRWHRVGGLWWSARFPFFKVLFPQGPKGPIERVSWDG